MTIEEAYEKYKHLDDPLLDERWMDNSVLTTMQDLWSAVKGCAELKNCQTCKNSNCPQWHYQAKGCSKFL